MRFSYKAIRTTSSLLGLTALTAGFGCSVALNTTAVQCLSESECLAMGPDFANTTCSPQTKTCVPVLAAGSCKTNDECTSRVGDAAICRKSDSRCVPLKTLECQTVMGAKTEYLNDEAVIIGALTPANDSQLGQMMEDALIFAQEKISKNANGLPPVNGSTNRRPVVIVGCNEFGFGTEGLIRAGRHLALDLQAPLIIGPVDTGNAIIIANNVTIPNKVTNLLPTSQLAALSEIPTPIAPTSLVWRMYLSDNEIAQAVGDFVPTVVETTVRKKLSLPDSEKIRVAIIREGNIYGGNVGAKVKAKLRFNGVSGDQNLTDMNLALFDIGDVRDPVNNPDPDATATKAVIAAAAFKPHIVIHVSALVGISKVLIPLEKNLPPDAPKPFHVAASPSWENQVLAQAIGPNVALRSRVFVVRAHTVPRKAEQAAFNSDFLGRFSDLTMPNFNPLVYFLYDSAFVSAFALAGVGSKPLTGQNVAQAMSLITSPGTDVDVTDTPKIPTGINTAFTGNAVQFNGLADVENFDPSTGGVKRSAEIACPFQDPMTKRFTFSGYVWDPAVAKSTSAFDPAKCKPPM